MGGLGGASVPVKYSGRTFLLQVSEDGSAWEACHSDRSTSFTIGGEQVDVTDKGATPWRELGNHGIRSSSVSCSGVVTDRVSFSMLMLAALSGVSLYAKITHGDDAEVVMSGLFRVSSFQRDGEHNGAESYSITLDSGSSVEALPPVPVIPAIVAMLVNANPVPGSTPVLLASKVDGTLVMATSIDATSGLSCVQYHRALNRWYVASKYNAPAEGGGVRYFDASAETLPAVYPTGWTQVSTLGTPEVSGLFYHHGSQMPDGGVAFIVSSDGTDRRLLVIKADGSIAWNAGDPVKVVFSIDRGYSPASPPPDDTPPTAFIETLTLTLPHAGGTQYSAGFSYRGDSYAVTFDSAAKTVIVTSYAGECYSGKSVMSTGASAFGSYPDAYDAWAGCTHGTGWLNVTGIVVSVGTSGSSMPSHCEGLMVPRGGDRVFAVEYAGVVNNPLHYADPPYTSWSTASGTNTTNHNYFSCIARSSATDLVALRPWVRYDPYSGSQDEVWQSSDNGASWSLKSRPWGVYGSMTADCRDASFTTRFDGRWYWTSYGDYLSPVLVSTADFETFETSSFSSQDRGLLFKGPMPTGVANEFLVPGANPAGGWADYSGYVKLVRTPGVGIVYDDAFSQYPSPGVDLVSGTPFVAVRDTSAWENEL